MSECSLSSKPPIKRRTWVQFGTRTLFVLIVLAAIAAWFARQQVVWEQRREELIATIESSGHSKLSLYPQAKVPWRRQLGAWLRGKPPTAGVDMATLYINDESSLLVDFIGAFPNTALNVRLNAKHASPTVLRSLARSKKVRSLDLFGDSFDTSDESLAQLGKIHVERGVLFNAAQVDDDLLRRSADANVDVLWICDLSFPEDTFSSRRRPKRVAFTEASTGDSVWGFVTNDGLRTAVKFRKLSWLHAGRKGGDDGVVAFHGHPAISKVELAGAGYTDASAETIASLQQLESLALVETRFTDAGIAKAIEKHQLSSLKLAKAKLGDKTIAALAAKNSLRQVELHDVPLSPELMAALANLPVESLTLRGDYNDDELSLLAPVAPKLVSIELNTPNVTDRGLAWLGDAGKLQSLNLNDTQAAIPTIKLIATMSPRLNVRLGGPNIDSVVLAEVSRTLQLRSLHLADPSIDDEALRALDPTFSLLMLSGTRVTTKGLGALKPSNTIKVIIFFPENAAPPLTPQEIVEIKTASAGRVDVTLQGTHPVLFNAGLPNSSRKSVVEAKNP
jgi:hypothetical protein